MYYKSYIILSTWFHKLNVKFGYNTTFFENNDTYTWVSSKSRYFISLKIVKHMYMILVIRYTLMESQGLVILLWSVLSCFS